MAGMILYSLGVRAQTMTRSGQCGPQLAVDAVACSGLPAPGEWLLTWHIRNHGSGLIRLIESWLPHGRFRAERRDLTPTPALQSLQSAELVLPVAWREPPGTEVENAFLIVLLLWRSETWRALTRLRVTALADGAPQPVTELITVQRVGFSTSTAD